MAADTREVEMSETAQALVRVTEAAAAAAGPWIGSGETYKNDADQAAVDAMHGELLRQTGELGAFACWVVIGEGVKDGAPHLKHGAFYGQQEPGRVGRRALDFAADPIEGTTSVALGEAGGMAIAALGEKGSFPGWLGIPYMHKLVVGPGAPAEMMDRGIIGLDKDPADNMTHLAAALNIPITDLRVAVLNRARNAEIIRVATELGVQLDLLDRGDVLPAMQVCMNDGAVHMLYGSGGAPEAVITAAFVAGAGGNMQAMWHPQTGEQAILLHAMGQLDKIRGLDRLVGTGEVHFAATGITNSALLEGCTKVGDDWLPGSSIVVSRPAK